MKRLLLILSLFLFVCAGLFCQTEILLIYKDDNINVKEKISVYVEVRDDAVFCFMLRNGDTNPLEHKVNEPNPNFEIYLTNDDFSLFRWALNKFLEWETVAAKNEAKPFTKEIPVYVETNAVIWSSYDSSIKGIMSYVLDSRINPLKIKFQFIWKYIYKDEYRARLNIESNTVYSIGKRAGFSLYVSEMKNEDINKFLENTTEEKIQEAIKNNREKEKELERQKKLQDDLFK